MTTSVSSYPFGGRWYGGVLTRREHGKEIETMFDEIIPIFYEPYYNFFVDEDGKTVDDLYSLVRPGDIEVFHHFGVTMVVPCIDRRGPIRLGIEIVNTFDEWTMEYYS